MSHQMTITLDDQEYQTLIAEAAKNGIRPETLLHEIMAQRLLTSTQTSHPLTEQEFMEKLYREGDLINLPSNEPLSSEEEAERERLGKLFAIGKPVSEMIIEDRGPY